MHIVSTRSLAEVCIFYRKSSQLNPESTDSNDILIHYKLSQTP